MDEIWDLDYSDINICGAKRRHVAFEQRYEKLKIHI